MDRCLQKVVLLIAFCFVSNAGAAYAFSDSTSLPASLKKHLNEYRQSDELDYWIYERIKFTERDPAARIDFLMRTQQEAWRSLPAHKTGVDNR